MKNSKMENKILILISSLAFILIFSACKADMVELKETSSMEPPITEESILDSVEVKVVEEFNPLAEREKTLDEAGINKDVIDISDVEDGRVYQAIKYAKLSVENDKIQRLLDVVNADLKEGAENFKLDNIEYVREAAKDFDMPDYRYEYDSTDVVATEMNDKYLSLRIFTYENMMGAHPTYYIEGHIFDVKEGKELKINDLVKDKETLRNFLYDWCDKNRESAELFDEYKSTIDDYLAGEYELQCYMEKDEIYVVFQIYDIAPYAAGAMHIKLPVEILR